jgi:hypothetical protein
MLNAIAYAKGMVAGHQLILHMLLHTRVTFDAALTVRPVLKTDTHSYTHLHSHTLIHTYTHTHAGGGYNVAAAVPYCTAGACCQ